MKLSKENILHLTNSYELLMHYLKPYSGGKLLRKNEHICSPLREERTPSFCIYSSKSGDWVWHDHGSGEGGSAFDLVMKLHNCDFAESLRIINSDMMLGLGQEDPGYTPPERVQIQPPHENGTAAEDKWFEVQPKQWDADAMQFWAQYGITKLSLDVFGVLPVRTFSSISAAGKAYTISDYRGPIFAYQIGEGTYKIYRPGQKKFKFLWLGNKPQDYVFGLSALPEQGEIIFLTGGEKDVITLHAMGYPAISLNSETATPSPGLITDLQSRFKKVVILYDNDETGIRRSKEIQSATGLPYISLPNFKGKDISDWVKTGHDSTPIEKLLSQLVASKPISPTIDPEPSETPAPTKAVNSSIPTSHFDSALMAVSRTYAQHESICVCLNLPLNPDFEQTRDGKIEVSYFEIDGKPYRVSAGKAGKQDAKRRIGNGNRINAVYIPPALRHTKKDPKPDLIGNTLFIVQDECTAWLMAELGMPAIGLPRPDGFLSRPQQIQTHKLITQVMRVLELTDVVYVLPSNSHQLATGDYEAKNPYEYIDSTENSRSVVNTLGKLQEAFERVRVDAIYPRIDGDIQPTAFWLDEMLVSLVMEQPQHWIRDIMVSVHAELYQPTKESQIFSVIPVSTGTANTFKEHMMLHSVDAWVAFHGIEKLGYIFQWGKNVYEYDRKDGSIDLYANSRSAYMVYEQNKRYYVEAKGGDIPISDFIMKYHLEVKQEDSFYLVEFVPLRGVAQFNTFHMSEIISADAFKKKVADIPGSKFNFWGSKLHIEQIHAMHRTGVKEAKSLAGLLGYDKRNGFYVYGNGILQEDGDFIEPNENGVAEIDSKNFYLPAAANQNEESTDYDHERGFQFYESGVEFFDWSTMFITVHGLPGHMIITFLVASLYRDIFRDQKYEVFPHFSIFAPPDSGKTAIANSLAAFFGKLKQTNLRAGATVASFDRKIALYVNSLLILNEFNLSNPQVQRGRLDEYLVGVYDYQAREKTINGKSRQALPNSAIVTIGQEAFWHREALASRCVIQILKPGNRIRSMTERENFNKLKEIEKDGISHFNRLFFTQRKVISANLRQYVEEIFENLKDRTSNYTTNRMLENWAMALAPMLILHDGGHINYPLSRQEIIDYAIKCIDDHTDRMVQEGVLSIFFSFLAAEYGPRKLLSHQDIWLYERKNELRIKISTCHKAFASYLNRENFGIENTSKQDLMDRLTSHPAFVDVKKGIQVGWKINASGSIAYNGKGKTMPAASGSTVIVMDYEKLDDFHLPDVNWGGSDEEDNQAEIEYAFHN